MNLLRSWYYSYVKNKVHSTINILQKNFTCDVSNDCTDKFLILTRINNKLHRSYKQITTDNT